MFPVLGRPPSHDPRYWVRQQEEDAGRKKGQAAPWGGFVLPRSSSLDSALDTGEAQPLACDPQAPAMMPVFQLRDEALGWGRRQRGPCPCSSLSTELGSDGSQIHARIRGPSEGGNLPLSIRPHPWKLTRRWALLKPEKKWSRLGAFTTAQASYHRPGEIVLHEVVSGLNSGPGLPGRPEVSHRQTPRTWGPGHHQTPPSWRSHLALPTPPPQPKTLACWGPSGLAWRRGWCLSHSSVLSKGKVAPGSHVGLPPRPRPGTGWCTSFGSSHAVWLQAGLSLRKPVCCPEREGQG